MGDYVLVMYPDDPTEPGETVDKKMMGYQSAWHAIVAQAEYMCHHPSPLIPTRIDVLTLEEWRARKALKSQGS